MDKKLKEEMRKAETEATDGLDFMDDDSELGKKCLMNIDTWMKEDNDEFFNGCLKKLGLCERKGLDGQLMLYPVKSKERKLEKEEFQEMMQKLYKVRDTTNDYLHLNERSKMQMNQNREFTKRMNLVHVDYSKKQKDIKMKNARAEPNQDLYKKKTSTPITNLFDYS